MARSLEAGRRVTLQHVGLFADGVAVKQVGKETFRLARQYVDEVIRVDTDATCAALKDVFEDTRSILEPAGALAIAGVKAYVERERVRDRTFVAIACGANMNFDRLRFVAERAEVGERREAILAVTIPERPGSFREFCGLLGKRSITEFNYRYADPKVAHLFVGIEVADRAETEQLLKALAKRHIEAYDLTDNEMAKLHVRHLVGGHAPSAEHEILYRFEFPERPGALMRFLGSMSAGWNISLFHYRNHGADYGRVLVGMQVPPRGQARNSAASSTASATTTWTRPATSRTGCSWGVRSALPRRARQTPVESSPGRGKPRSSRGTMGGAESGARGGVPRGGA
jgi:threonine dehydratase